MAQRGVPGSATIEGVAPGHGMARPHLAARVCAFVEADKDSDSVAGISPEVVPLVRSRPSGRQMRRRRVASIDDQRGLLDCRMIQEVRPDETPVPRPVVLGIGRRVDPDETAALLDVALEGRLLFGVEYISAGVQEHDDAVARQALVGE